MYHRVNAVEEKRTFRQPTFKKSTPAELFRTWQSYSITVLHVKFPEIGFNALMGRSSEKVYFKQILDVVI